MKMSAVRTGPGEPNIIDTYKARNKRKKHGVVVEWPMAPDLKSGEGKTSVSSNLTDSAFGKLVPELVNTRYNQEQVCQDDRRLITTSTERLV